ncbi:hypothetical protein POM88_002772 [Heracleum sosnowskyi]|uniref:C3H1-type domain-containing protein n=1 Tax=Heracleum sosnowskyi TaxID=360622 RepID=A0AAD8JIK1_9APIA|nr:hypothetical protein POM88_002772 [Heracleum sosnowskyi]
MMVVVIQIGQYGAELPQRVGQPDCGYFLKTGTCKYGASCKYHHPLDRHGVGPLVLNTLGLPMRQDENPCPHYMRTGACKFGIGCKFHHPQPDSAVPVTGPAAYGSTTSWSSPKSTYVSVPRSGSHTYMSVMYWNDPSVLQKLGEAMGLPVSGDAVASAETSGQDESDEVGNEGESIVHNTASVGDVEEAANMEQIASKTTLEKRFPK